MSLNFIVNRSTICIYNGILNVDVDMQNNDERSDLFYGDVEKKEKKKNNKEHFGKLMTIKAEIEEVAGKKSIAADNFDDTGGSAYDEEESGDKREKLLGCKAVDDLAVLENEMEKRSLKKKMEKIQHKSHSRNHEKKEIQKKTKAKNIKTKKLENDKRKKKWLSSVKLFNG